MAQAGSVSLEANPDEGRTRRDLERDKREAGNRSTGRDSAGRESAGRDDVQDHEDGGRRDGGGKDTKTGRSRWLRYILMVGGVLLLLVLVLLYWLFSGGSISVTDTYVRAAQVSLSTDVSGLVSKVEVHDHQVVKPGQVLFRLDSNNFQIAITAAQANMAAVKQQVSGAKQAYAGDVAKVKAQQVLVQNDQVNFDRYASLVHSGGVTRAAYDDAKYKLAGDQAQLLALKAQTGVSLAKLSNNANIHITELPQYKTAQAQLEQAELNLRHSVVRAPFGGIVTETETLQPGMYLAAGTAAFGLVSNSDIWVRSQPKESELTWVKPGDKAKVRVDTYPGKVWDGVVSSISPATGSSFSILPAENSSGNWVKVVQRIPLRVNITGGPQGLALRNGMSAEVTIITGHKNKLSDLF